MMTDTNHDLSPECELAVAYTPAALRDAMRTSLALDQRIGRIVAATSEPIMGQMRLAWWRDMLGIEPSARPRGDPVLDAIGAHWAGGENALVELVDGWEVLIACDALDAEELRRVAQGRNAPFVELFGGEEPNIRSRVKAAGTRYCLADIASRISDRQEREAAIRLGLELEPGNIRLPREARGLAVLEALAIRALKRGGRPLMEGRGAGLAAFRAGFLGR